MNIRTNTIYLALFTVLSAWLIAGFWSEQDYLNDARALTGQDWPIPVEVRATTNGSVYMANLNGQIGELERLTETQAGSRFTSELARLLYHRFQVTGRLADAESALSILSKDNKPDDGGTALVSARILMGFHEFDKARSALKQAEEHGVPKDQVNAVKTDISRALGESNPMHEDVSPTPVNLVSQASGWREEGRPDKASELLKKAQDIYSDSSPYTLAWIQVQQGIVFLENEDYLAARTFFSAAHQRFPQYTLAAEHLAETELALGNYDVAARLYRNVVSNSEHPEFYHQLSKAESLLGNQTSARQAAQLAEQGYQDLVEKYPLMFADHAVGFYIDIGDRSTAVQLAEVNFTQRNNRSAEQLLLTARECCQ